MAKVIKTMEQKNTGKKKKIRAPKHKGKDCKGTSFLSKPYSERQFIVVADDKLIKGNEKLRHKPEMTFKSEGVKRTKIILRTLENIVPATYLFTDVVGTVLKAVGKLKSKGIDAIFISKKEAQKLIFPPGHPQEKVLYVGHPTKPEIYYPFSEFHRMTFEHKFSEALEMLMSLGATEIEVYRVKGWSNEFSAKLNVSIKDWEPGIEVSKDKKAAGKLLFKASFKGKKKPTLPKNLVWYPHEQTWQKIAEGRMKYGMKNFALIIQYEDNFGVNTGLKVKVIKSGLDIGGKFEDHKKTAWRIVGKFGKAT